MANILIIGGSGFLSGTLAGEAMRGGDAVWVLTRGKRPAPAGANVLVADRKDRAAFAQVIADAGVNWDMAIDCIGFDTDDALQDLEVFSGRAEHLIFISSDFAMSPVGRPWKIDEAYDRFDTAPYGAGKRRCEEVFLRAQGEPRITILRPCHIYGPGSLLGCLPLHGRDANLIDRIQRGEILRLLGGGYFLQQPLLAADLWPTIKSCMGNSRVSGQIYFAPGPEIVQSRDFYRTIGEVLGVEVKIEEASMADYLREQPDHRAFCTHRVYAIDKAREHGLVLPATPMRAGLQQHVESLLDQGRQKWQS